MTQKNSSSSTMNGSLRYAVCYLMLSIIVTNAFQYHKFPATRSLSSSSLARQHSHHWSQQLKQQIRRRSSSSCSSLSVANLRDADLFEMMVGGIRYEMVPLPDSMMDTTLFVGNLNEFVHDDDLSQLFQSVTHLQSVPACVARRPNMASLHYGFVSFQTVEEKEAAILRFNGCIWKGQSIKVEPIRDDPKAGRVRVPERMVQYVSGSAKKTRDGRMNTMRRIARQEEQMQKQKQQDRKKKRKQQQKQKQIQNSSIAHMVSRLSMSDQQEFLRSIRKGFVTLEGTGYRRGRKTSNLACVHRQWCDENGVPQIIFCKASGGRPLDNVIVDLSPLRISAMLINDNNNSNDNEGEEPADDFLLGWKVQIMTAATKAGMDFRSDYVEDNCAQLSACDDELFEDGCGIDFDIEDNAESYCESEVPQPQHQQEYVVTLSDSDFAASDKPISQLPVLSMGVFEGERSMAKSMARELAETWNIPQEPSKGLQEQIKSSSSHGKQKRRKDHTKNHQNDRRRQRQRTNTDTLDFYFK